MLEKEHLIQELLQERYGNSANIPQEKIDQSMHYMKSIQDLIELCGDDPTRDGFKETPYRVLKAFMEYTKGYHEDPKKHLEKIFDVSHNEIVLVKDIDFYSMCEHHLAPFFGQAHVAYIPNEKITGLSKIARMVEGYARRFQVQERLSDQIANALVEVLDPLGVMVVMNSKHMCMCSRGVNKSNSETTTTSARGIFAEDTARRTEFLSLMNL